MNTNLEIVMLDFPGEYARDAMEAIAAAEWILRHAETNQARIAYLMGIRQGGGVGAATVEVAAVIEALAEVGLIEALCGGRVTPEQLGQLLNQPDALREAHRRLGAGSAPAQVADVAWLTDPQRSEDLRTRLQTELGDLHSAAVRAGQGLPSERELADALANKIFGPGLHDAARSQRLYFYEMAAAEILALRQRLADAPTQEMARDETLEDTTQQWRQQVARRHKLDATLLRPYVLLRDAGRSPDEIAELLSIPKSQVEGMLKLAIYQVEMAA
jgi:hypothetical protein